MEKVTNALLPAKLFLRYLQLPQTAEEATKQCEVCSQVIEPKQLVMNGEVRYSPRKCPCQQAKEQQGEAERIRAEIRDAQARYTYMWLGRDRRWSDVALREKTFENFNRERQAEAFEVAQAFASNPSGTLVLHGTYGTGKTHLLAAVCNAVLLNEKSVRSLFTTSPKLFAAIQECIGHGEDYSWLIEKAMTTPLLVIDDIDKAKWSAFREEIYFSIIDERVKAGRPTAISTNRLDELADFVGGAVCSRFKVGQVEAEMLGEDYREEV